MVRISLTVPSNHRSHNNSECEWTSSSSYHNHNDQFNKHFTQTRLCSTARQTSNIEAFTMTRCLHDAFRLCTQLNAPQHRHCIELVIIISLLIRRCRWMYMWVVRVLSINVFVLFCVRRIGCSKLIGGWERQCLCNGMCDCECIDI